MEKHLKTRPTKVATVDGTVYRITDLGLTRVACVGADGQSRTLDRATATISTITWGDWCAYARTAMRVVQSRMCRELMADPMMARAVDMLGVGPVAAEIARRGGK